MAERRAIPRSTRFEVFKRDSFTCQYCGASAPNALLRIDHIRPVCEGGDNDLTNLITACQPCNAGKGARELSDQSVVERQKRQLDELSERRSQLEMMMEWRQGLISLESDKSKMIEEAISHKSQFTPNEIGRQKIQKWIKKYGMAEILDAIDTAFLQYLDIDGEGIATAESWNRAFNYPRDHQRNAFNERKAPLAGHALHSRHTAKSVELCERTPSAFDNRKRD